MVVRVLRDLGGVEVNTQICFPVTPDLSETH